MQDVICRSSRSFQRRSWAAPIAGRRALRIQGGGRRKERAWPWTGSTIGSRSSGRLTRRRAGTELASPSRWQCPRPCGCSWDSSNGLEGRPHQHCVQTFLISWLRAQSVEPCPTRPAKCSKASPRCCFPCSSADRSVTCKRQCKCDGHCGFAERDGAIRPECRVRSLGPGPVRQPCRRRRPMSPSAGTPRKPQQSIGSSDGEQSGRKRSSRYNA